MNHLGRRHFLYVAIIILSALIVHGGNAASSDKQGKRIVWIVFFSSHDCPKCESVKDLIEILKVRYPVRVRQFDISRESDYAVYKRMESIHAAGNFGVPLVMLGESILIGEQEILDKLEKKVQELKAEGGAPSPYIGPVKQGNMSSAVEKKGAACESCARDGRPPQVGDELRRVRGFLDKVF